MNIGFFIVEWIYKQQWDGRLLWLRRFGLGGEVGTFVWIGLINFVAAFLVIGLIGALCWVFIK